VADETTREGEDRVGVSCGLRALLILCFIYRSGCFALILHAGKAWLRRNSSYDYFICGIVEGGIYVLNETCCVWYHEVMGIALLDAGSPTLANINEADSY